MFPYKKTFKLKNLQQQQTVNFLLYKVAIDSTVDIYNNVCARTPNKKHIVVSIYKDRLDFDIQSEKELNPKYVGIALRFFSQILVQNFGFLAFCTNTNPKKLFVTT